MQEDGVHMYIDNGSYFRNVTGSEHSGDQSVTRSEGFVGTVTSTKWRAELLHQGTIVSLCCGELRDPAEEWALDHPVRRDGQTN
jgi:hypothetical protein